jgi:tetratricopeptide (TPR) repeat protein
MRRSTSVLVACGALLLLGFSSVAAVRNWMGERALSEARKEQKRGNINGARDLYGDALALGRTEGAVALAKMALYRRDWKGVETYAAEAMKADPSDAYPHILLAHAAAVSGKPDGAEGVEFIFGECRKASFLEPLNGKNSKSCADLFLGVYMREIVRWTEEEEKGRFREETLEAYRHALEGAPGDDAAWFEMGRAAEMMNDKETAEASYRRAVELREGNARYRKALSRITGEQ